MAAPELTLVRPRNRAVSTRDHSPTNRAPANASLRQGPVAERLATYFRALGLSDERCLAKAAQVTLAQLAAGAMDARAEDLPRCAVEAAVQLATQWLDALVVSAPGATDASTARGLALWRLRGPLGRHPEAFLKRDALPDDFRRAMESAAAPIVPERKPAPMVPQQLGDLPFVLRFASWHRLGCRIASFWQRARTTFTGA